MGINFIPFLHAPLVIQFHVLVAFIAIAGGAARKKQIKKHQRIMSYAYLLGLIITGFFTLWPGRLLHQIFVAGGSVS